VSRSQELTEWYVQQAWPSLAYRAVPVDHWQACKLRERLQAVYSSQARAWAVARALNRARREQGKSPDSCVGAPQG